MKYLVRSSFLLALCAAAPVWAQGSLAPDAAGCVDSKSLPKLVNCRIDNCEKKDSDHQEVTVFENVKGDQITEPLDGDSHSVMYECTTAVTPALIINQAAKTLRAAGFVVPYVYAADEGALTARKGELWLTLDAASHYYTLYEIRALPDDTDTVIDADSLAHAIARDGHVAIYAIQFTQGTSQFTPGAEDALKEIATLLQQEPEWSLRIEGHTDATAPKPVNMALSSRRATAVANWLSAHGVQRTRLDPQGLGEAGPIGDNTTEAGRAKNNRIELVKITAPTVAGTKP